MAGPGRLAIEHILPILRLRFRLRLGFSHDFISEEKCSDLEMARGLETPGL